MKNLFFLGLSNNIYVLYITIKWNNKVLYTGMTNNLEGRIMNIKRNKRVARKKKEILIESINPRWKRLIRTI